MNIYSSARPVLKVDRLIGHLKALDYRYPYHQTIGFLMQRAGFPEQDYGKLKNPGLRFDFYLSHRIESPRYDSEWKLYYPRDL